jgi:hypothetical protein
MRGADDAAGRGQDEVAGSLALSPPRVRGLFGLSSAIFDYVERLIEGEIKGTLLLWNQNKYDA